MTATAMQPNGHTPSADAPAVQGQASKVQPGDVGWQFVPQYYNFVNKQPHRLHCFYNKRSTFTHGEEGEEVHTALGQQEIHDRITAIGYDQCKVYIHSIDSQSSANGGIIILVIGEMSNINQSWRKFTQTFFLAEQPNGYFVLNDIFRYLKEEVDDEEEEEEIPEEIPVEVPLVAAPVPVPVPNQPESRAEPASLEKDVGPAAQPAPEPDPVQSPAHPDPEIVPDEAVIAAVPDHDVAPSEPTAVEEPTTSTNPSIEEVAPEPSRSAASDSLAPAQAATNGARSPAAAAAPAPSKPGAPKSWASMAAAASNPMKAAWGAAPSGSQPAAVSPALAPPAPSAVKQEEPAPAASSSSPSQQRHPYYENAMRVQTPHCFVKLPNWSIDNQAGGESMDETTLRQVAARFGEVAKVEIVKTKACAFVEFSKVESARRAIVASLSVPQGGEGGVKAGSGEGKLNFETRKEKDERRPKGGNRGGPPERGGARGGARMGGRDGVREDGFPNGERANGPPNGAPRGRGRGRGGPGGGGGDRPAPQTVPSK